MSKKAFVVLTLGVTVVFLLSSAGCVSKKRLRTVEQQNAEQLAQANGRIGELQQANTALENNLKGTQTALDAAKGTNDQLKQSVGSLKDQITGLEGARAELEKAVAAGKETEESLTKQIRGLNGQIAALRKKAAEMEATIAAREGDISSLQQNVASLKAAAEEQSKAMAALNASKDSVSAQLAKTVSDKKTMTLVLGVLLALAIILAIIGFVRKKGAAA
jgi:chromosome segregation ATPase